MSQVSFVQKLIQEQISIAKNRINSKFDTLLEHILREDEIATGTVSSPPDTSAGGPPAAPNNNPIVPQADDQTELPPENADIQIKLAKLAALALLTNLDKVVEDHEEMRQDEIFLSRLKNSGVTGGEDSIKVLQKILKIVKLGGNTVNFDINQNFIDKFDPAANDAITNLIVKVLFISKDKILQNNDSLRGVIDSIGTLLSQIKPIEQSDPAAAVKIASEIIQKINNDILPSADLTI